MLSEGWQNAIRFKNREKDDKGAKKDLLKIRMMYYEKLNTIDKLFVDYCLALHTSRLGEIDSAKMYLKEMKEVLDREGKDNYKVDYYRYLWFNVNLNHKSMPKSKVIKDMLEIHYYFESMGDYLSSLGAIANIYSLGENGDMVLELLIRLLDSHVDIKIEVLNSFLEDLKKLNKELYIKGKNIINNYFEREKAN